MMAPQELTSETDILLIKRCRRYNLIEHDFYFVDNNDMKDMPQKINSAILMHWK